MHIKNRTIGFEFRFRFVCVCCYCNGRKQFKYFIIRRCTPIFGWIIAKMVSWFSIYLTPIFIFINGKTALMYIWNVVCCMDFMWESMRLNWKTNKHSKTNSPLTVDIHLLAERPTFFWIVTIYKCETHWFNSHLIVRSSFFLFLAL